MNKSKKRKLKKRIIVIPIICIIAIVGITALIVAKKYSDSIVKVVSVSELGGMYDQSSLGEIYVYGNLKQGSVNKINVDSELSIDEVKVEKGDTVKKGDTVLTYDTELLKLNVEASKTQVDTINNQIKVAENELRTLKGLIPLENVSPMPMPTEPPENDIITEEPLPELVEYEKEISKKTTPLSGDGSENDPFVFNVGEDTVVKMEYMNYLAGEKTVVEATAPTENATESTAQQIKSKSKYAIFHIYNERGLLLYSWLVDGTKIKYNDIEDWQCSEGVVLAEDGSIQINQGANLFASIITYGGNSSITEEDIPGEIYPEYPENDASQSITIGEALDNQNYMYTQAELKDMISEKESEIDNLKFSKRQAEIDLSNAEKTLETGNEVAEISGTVTFVAKSAEEAQKEGSYITIINDSITNVVGSVSENDLQYLSVGMSAIVTNNADGEEYDAKITHISKELSQAGGYDKYGMYDDTTSYYDVTFELNEKAELKDDEEVIIIIETDDATESVWVENAFIRTENGKSYVMVANENNVIEKRYVKLGRRFFDASTEIVSGISADDRIGLPYGKTVEGMPTVDATYDEMYSGFLF